MTEEKILASIKKAREDSKRNFKQSFDLAINLKSIDLKKPDNKVKTEIKMPHAFGSYTIGIFAENLASQAKEFQNVVVIKKDQIEAYGKNKKEAKKFARSCNYFLAEAPMMPMIGKNLGPFLAPKNRMPSPVPPTSQNLKSIVDQKRNVVKVALKDSPTIHMAVGTEEMKDEEVAENIDFVVKSVLAILPKGKEQMRNVIIKLTMGKPVKVIL
ncbi:MAG: 50S ribosomal protein L1 [Candidatus Aenigmatarchaeota archaeon]